MTDTYPSEADKSTDVYNALPGTTHAGTQIDYPSNAGPTTSPTLKVVLMELFDKMLNRLTAPTQGLVVRESSTQIGVYPLDYYLNGVRTHFAGATGQTISGNGTWYVYLDSDNTLQVGSSGFPDDGGAAFPLAEVVMASGAIATDAITDKRPLWWRQDPTHLLDTIVVAGGAVVCHGGNVVRNS